MQTYNGVTDINLALKAAPHRDHYGALAITRRPQGKWEQGGNEESAYRCGFVFSFFSSPPVHILQHTGAAVLLLFAEQANQNILQKYVFILQRMEA